MSAQLLRTYRRKDGKGRVVIDEGHPQTNTEFAVCRALHEGSNTLSHTVIIARKDLVREPLRKNPLVGLKLVAAETLHVFSKDGYPTSGVALHDGHGRAIGVIYAAFGDGPEIARAIVERFNAKQP